MGVLKNETEFRSSIAPARLFRALVLDSDNFIPKVSPNDIKSVEILEGDGGVGTIRKITYTDRSKYKYAKQKIEAIDQDNLQITYSLIEGGALTDKIEKITYINKFVEAPGGGTVIKSISEYYTIGDEDRSITNDDKIKEYEEKYTHTFNILGNYLLDNYDAYN